MILYKNEHTVKPVLRGQRKGGLIRQVTSQKRLNSSDVDIWINKKNRKKSLRIPKG
jgi:hypothetical protein